MHNIPNFEVKYPKTISASDSLKNRIKISIGPDFLYTSELEPQIAYKLYLGSDKDIEDAIYLYKLFKDKLDMALLAGFAKQLGIGDLLNELK